MPRALIWSNIIRRLNRGLLHTMRRAFPHFRDAASLPNLHANIIMHTSRFAVNQTALSGAVFATVFSIIFRCFIYKLFFQINT